VTDRPLQEEPVPLATEMPRARDLAVRGGIALCLLLNAVSYFSWGRAAMRSDLAIYVKNHAIREIAYGIALSAGTAWLLRRPLDSRTASWALFLSGASVLGFWLGLFALGGLEGVDTIFPGGSAGLAFSLHGPQLAAWTLAAALAVRGPWRSAA
jgi:hypothetical protein